MFTTAITGITTLLASATFLWIAAIIIIIAMAIFLEHEEEGWATTFFSIGIALVLWNFRGELWAIITSNPTATIGFIVSYILLGIVWSFIKWRSYVISIFTKFKNHREKFIKNNGVITDKNLKDFNREISNVFKDPNGNGYNTVSTRDNDTLEFTINKISPVASNKKTVITSWISYWPVSVMATLLNNPFRRFFEWIYSNLSGFYDKITSRYQNDALGGNNK